MLEQENIFLNEDLNSKKEILEFIANKALELGISYDKDGLLKDLWKREGEYSTGIQDGFAIPHSKSKYIKKPSSLYIKTNNAVEWETLDDSDVRYVFSLLAPEENKDNVHLQMLSKLATCLLEDDFKDEVKNEDNKENLLKYILRKMEE